MTSVAAGDASVSSDLQTRLESAKLGNFLLLADSNLRLFSVFDDLRYDRADADLLSPAMRKHAIARLGTLGFKQTTGTILTEPSCGIRCLIPKFHALGASPFDITRYTPRNDGDYFLLTPTQTACQFIDHYPHEEAVERIRDLIRQHPINLYRLMDYLETKPAHAQFQNAIGHLKYVQREAITSDPLRTKRALG